MKKKKKKKKKKKIPEFLSENFQFLVVKFSIYLNRRVFVMARIESQLDLTAELETNSWSKFLLI